MEIAMNLDIQSFHQATFNIFKVFVLCFKSNISAFCIFSKMAQPPLLNIFSSCRPYFSSGWGQRQTAAAGGAPEPGQQTLDSATSVCVCET